jgi:DNA invertase Pin-like site-specific DNA recombinase
LRIGYARKTAASELELQRAALSKAKCDRILWELTDTREAKWPRLNACLASLRSGDILVVWRLDRLGNDLGQFLRIQSSLTRRGIGFESIAENIETTSRAGRMASRVFQSLYAFNEAAHAGPSSTARIKRVVKGKRSKKACDRSSYDPKFEQVRTLMDSSEFSIADVAEMFDLSKSMVYRIWMDRRSGDRNDERPA